MGTFPATFIQIHYHYRHGGVKHVLDRYSELCRICSNGKTRSLLLCCVGDEKAGPFHSEVLDEPLLDYTAFESPQEFDRVNILLQSRFESVITSPGIQYPVAILFHNVSLGKNAAASAAFTETARRFGSDMVRFFSVVHDFAEEGRKEMLNVIGKVHTWRKSIDEELHCVGAPVTYVVPGKRSFDILSRLKYPVQMLPNSVLTRTAQVDKRVLRAELTSFAHEKGLTFDMSKPVWYCSSRIIQRKNIFETILLSCLFDTCLILGPEGTSQRDKLLSEIIYGIARKYRLNLLVNPAQSGYFQNHKIDIVSAIYSLCSVAVTTSVAEGFGFGLYEPYFHEKPLLGRRPLGFVYPCGVKNDHLYEMLPVPADSINKNTLIASYYETFGHDSVIKKKADYIADAEIVDFADLDIQHQRELLVRFFEDWRFQKKWVSILDLEFPGWSGLQYLHSNAMDVFETNRVAFKDFFSEQNDQKRFYSTFSTVPLCPDQPVEQQNIKDAFAAEGLSLLL
jgi:hypothetical protein